MTPIEICTGTIAEACRAELARLRVDAAERVFDHTVACLVEIETGTCAIAIGDVAEGKRAFSAAAIHAAKAAAFDALARSARAVGGGGL